MLKIDTSEYDAAIKRVMADVTDTMATKVLAKVTIDTLRNLQKETPKKDGRARAGWHPNIGQTPSEWVAPEKDKRLKKMDLKIRYDSIINLTNNVEYIIPLEEGHSRQKPNGFMNIVLARMTAELNSLTHKDSNRKIK